MISLKQVNNGFPGCTFGFGQKFSSVYFVTLPKGFYSTNSLVHFLSCFEQGLQALALPRPANHRKQVKLMTARLWLGAGPPSVLSASQRLKLTRRAQVWWPPASSLQQPASSSQPPAARAPPRQSTREVEKAGRKKRKGDEMYDSINQGRSPPH